MPWNEPEMIVPRTAERGEHKRSDELPDEFRAMHFQKKRILMKSVWKSWRD
jgi:hypothetical protein